MMASSKDRTLLYWIALNSIPFIRGSQFQALRSFFHDDLSKVFGASKEILSRVPMMTPSLCDQLINSQNLLGLAEKELKWIATSPVEIICCDESEYPSLLKEISDPPPLLYVQGKLPHTKLSVGVVGTRRATPYGLEATEHVCRGLVERASSGITIVSGLAKGIDRRAHEVALEGGGKTIAVLGNGIRVVYPREHRWLYEKISLSGAIVSEFPLMAKPLYYHFPRRNRIISGLCHGIVVIEAPQKSGALITAEFALEQGREVFCVPGKISSHMSEGTHELIKQGASLITSADDILRTFPGTDLKSHLKDNLTRDSNFVQSLSDKEKRVLCLLESIHQFEELVDYSEMSAEDLSQLLVTFEMNGLIARKQHHYYRRGACPSRL